MEIGPGYPGMFPFFKESKQNYYISESNKKIVELFSKDKVKSISHNDDNRRFDLIICANVIYYFVDIHSSLKKIKNNLSKNGLLFIDILNSNTLSQKYMGETDQINIFSKKSIEYILIKNGFKILSSVYTCSYSADKKLFKNKNMLEKLLNRIGYMSYKNITKILIQNSESKYLNSKSPYLHIVYKKN